MAADPKIRASDEDRDRAVSLLREHHAAGRLDAEEFSERLDKAYAAKTLGELDELMADLPAIDLYRLPDAGLPRYGRPKPGASSLVEAAAARPGGLARGHGRFSPVWVSAWGSWFTVSLVCFVVWAISGAGYPWPLWIAAPWGAIMVGRWITGAHPGGGRRHHRRELPGGADQTGQDTPGS
jgi:hypothetical protein